MAELSNMVGIDDNTRLGKTSVCSAGNFGVLILRDMVIIKKNSQHVRTKFTLEKATWISG